MNTLVGNYELARVVEVWSLKAKPFFCFGFVVSTFQDGVSCSQGWLRAHYMAKHGFKLMICLFSPPECWGFRGVDDHTLLNSSFCLWVLNAVSLTMSQNHTLEHVIPASRWLSWLLINYFFSTHLCVVLRVLKHGGKEYGSRFQGELSDGHK